MSYEQKHITTKYCKIIPIHPKPKEDETKAMSVEDTTKSPEVIILDNVRCHKCGEDIKLPSSVDGKNTAGVECKGCKVYLPTPGSTIDVSNPEFKNFDLNNVFGGRRKFQPAESRHDEPCPMSSMEDIAHDQPTNEWVFNHLPLSEEQKEQLLLDLAKDQKVDRLEEAKKRADSRKTKTYEQVKKERAQKKKGPSSHRETVKSIHLTEAAVDKSGKQEKSGE